MTLNKQAWELKHKLITDSINRSGSFNLEEINRTVFETLKISSYELPEQEPQDIKKIWKEIDDDWDKQHQNRVVGALRKVLK